MLLLVVFYNYIHILLVFYFKQSFLLFLLSFIYIFSLVVGLEDCYELFEFVHRVELNVFSLEAFAIFYEILSFVAFKQDLLSQVLLFVFEIAPFLSIFHSNNQREYINEAE